ncbi:MAG: hypothetical protein ACD_41C00058G0003 [uncultured bacterium]|nr:MAG: hypothetical protein ACD_41C00058G0003 [uncultured bacterium]HBY73964.1 sulfotransferase family protein [Candidatus Kerfeldbacteria bacterium]
MITIVSGLPRSGTSLMMKMLEAGGMKPLIDDIRTADVDNPKGYYEFERVKQLPQDTGWLPEAEGKVVKMVSMLLYELPKDYQYKVIFMRRAMPEILASQKKMLLRRNADMHIDDAEMKELFEGHLKNMLAWLQTQPHLTALEIWYNDVMKQPAVEVQKINQFLGGNLKEADMISVVDETLYRNRT